MSEKDFEKNNLVSNKGAFEKKKDGSLTRRDFMVSTAVVGAGAAVLATLSSNEATAQATKESPPAKTSGSTLKVDDVLKVAREKLYPYCRVCPECNGVACAGEVPGLGGIGTGSSFRANYDSLARYHLKMRTFHEVKKPDTAITLWGVKLDMPILPASMGGTKGNMGGKMSEAEFTDSILAGSIMAGTLGLTTDIFEPLPVYEKRIETITSHRGKGIAIIKPRTQEEIIKRIRIVEASGALAVGIDIDSVNLAARAPVEPKTPKQLKQIISSTKLPFIIKGIMTAEEAQVAVEAGAAAIVVSNHGGRVLDHTPGVAEVLPEIAQKVKGKVIILCDGGIRYGTDVLKLTALGADAVLVGRPMIRGAFGGGREGVALLLNKMKNELRIAMIMTGTANLRNVSKDILA
jgi:4-hydroxymandelate oxidase